MSSTSSPPNPRRWKALWVIALAQFMVIMDTSVIGVALPRTQVDLGFSQKNLSWVFNASVIALVGALIAWLTLRPAPAAATAEPEAGQGPSRTAEVH